MTAPRCEAAPAFNVQTGEWAECGRPATSLYRYGCVHEHVAGRWTCPGHAPVPGDVGCRQCFDHGRGHNCPMAFQAVSS